MSHDTINRQWTEFGKTQLMQAARQALHRLARRPADDQDACDVIAIAFGRYQEHYRDVTPPIFPNAMIRSFLHYAAKNVSNLKRDAPIGDAQRVTDNYQSFNPKTLLESIAKLPARLRDTAYAVATLGCPNDAAKYLGVSRSCVSKRLAAMRMLAN